MRFLAALPLFALAACATTPDNDEPIEVAPQGECDVTAVEWMVGERADAVLGGRVHRITRSTSFRWIPPRTAVTQDYRPDRVNVVYDDDYVVTRIYCG
jgi:hypothetical protein